MLSPDFEALEDEITQLRKDLAGMVQVNTEQFELRTQDHEEILSLRVALAEREAEIASKDKRISKLQDVINFIKPTIERLMYEAEGSYGKNFSAERAEQARKNYVKIQEVLYVTKSTPPSTSYLEQWEKDRYQIFGTAKNVMDDCVFATSGLVGNTSLYARKD
jgi:chromosome segregation ATPase